MAQTYILLYTKHKILLLLLTKRLIIIFLLARSAQSNIGLTFKAWPERSEGLAWFLRDLLAKTMTKGFIRLKQLFDVLF